MKPRLLLIEDDPHIRRFLRASLPTQGYELLEAASGREGLSLAASQPADVLLVDLGLPDLEGIEVIRQVREWSLVPIIVLSARDQEREKVATLDAGADDYLTKPFGVGELLARIRVALRRSARNREGRQEAVFAMGKVRVDLEKRRVFRGEEEVHLTPIEYKLLSVLIKYCGKVVTHRQLLKEVWGPAAVDQTAYLRIFVLNLRRKLEDDPTRPAYLLTDPGVGYRLRDQETPGG